MLHPRQACHHHAEGHSACPSYPGRKVLTLIFSLPAVSRESNGIEGLNRGMRYEGEGLSFCVPKWCLNRGFLI